MTRLSGLARNAFANRSSLAQRVFRLLSLCDINESDHLHNHVAPGIVNRRRIYREEGLRSITAPIPHFFALDDFS